jgi:AraC family transcriptional regulator of adaptative response / DNA-3-methyladenine glycosylase II
MQLDRQACRRARLARDARFDGKFFVGIISTKIYCRPSCPVPTVKDKNVRYFVSASAAAEAGYRPCLRCRPECVPGTPAWMGTPATVSRALRLIAESDLDDRGVEKLALRLGVGTRHLRRLFLEHLGATPSAVVHTRRLQFAKKLIDETSLPMHQIALAAGFGCVRRFNATIRKTWQRTPTQIRRLAHRPESKLDNQYVFHLRYRPPYRWDEVLAFLGARAIPGVEVVENGVYRRSIALNGSAGWFEAAFDEAAHSLLVHVQFPDPQCLFFITERIRTMFDLNADWLAINPVLRADARLARRVDAAPGLRVAGCWDGFELTTRVIAGQAATARLVRDFGQPFSCAGGITHVFPTPAVLADARIPKIRDLARAVHDGRIGFERTAASDVLLERLRKISGIGNRATQYVAMRAFGEPDAFPYADAALLKRAEAWRPWRSYATMYLWSADAGSSSRRR